MVEDMQEQSRPPRILFYVDMEGLIPTCVAAAEMLRNGLGAQIIMVVYDRCIHRHEAFKNYELYDHSSIFPLSRLFGKAVPFVPYVLEDDLPQAREAGAKSAGIPEARPKKSLLRQMLGRSSFVKRVYLGVRYAVYRAWWAIRNLPGPILVSQAGKVVLRSFQVRSFLRAVQPDAIILLEDNLERASSTFVNEGHKLGIPSAIIPFTIPNPLEPAKSYRNSKAHRGRGPLGWLVRAYFPKWVFRIDDKPLLRVPATAALAFEIVGESSPAPWILNRGNAARILLDSDAQRQAYLELGFPPEQLCVIGDIQAAALYQGLKNKLQYSQAVVARFGFQPGRPLILCGFPPDQYASKLNEFEFPDYETLIQKWIGSFSALGERANVLVRPHPRMSVERLSAFRLPNVRFTDEPTVELIPACDLYVACISATIRWAIACGIPVINYDTYRYRYGDYDKASAVLHVESISEFKALLDRFLDEPSFVAELTARQRGEMRHWGMVDDQVPARLCRAVLEFIHKRRLLN